MPIKAVTVTAALEICTITGALGFASVWSGGQVTSKHSQLMLTMLAFRLVKSAQSLGCGGFAFGAQKD